MDWTFQWHNYQQRNINKYSAIDRLIDYIHTCKQNSLNGTASNSTSQKIKECYKCLHPNDLPVVLCHSFRSWGPHLVTEPMMNVAPIKTAFVVRCGDTFSERKSGCPNAKKEISRVSPPPTPLLCVYAVIPLNFNLLFFFSIAETGDRSLDRRPKFNDLAKKNSTSNER